MQEHRQIMEKAALGLDLTQIATALQKHKVSTLLVSDIPTSLPVRLGTPEVTVSFPSKSTHSPTLLGSGNRTSSPPGCVCRSHAEGTQPQCQRAPRTARSSGKDGSSAANLAAALDWSRKAARLAANSAASWAGRAYGAGRDAWRLGTQGPASSQPLVPPHSTFLTRPRRRPGFSRGRNDWRALPAGRTRQTPRPCCSNTCAWSKACAPSRRNCGS